MIPIRYPKKHGPGAKVKATAPPPKAEDRAAARGGGKRGGRTFLATIEDAPATIGLVLGPGLEPPAGLAPGVNVARATDSSPAALREAGRQLPKCDRLVFLHGPLPPDAQPFDLWQFVAPLREEAVGLVWQPGAFAIRWGTYGLIGGLPGTPADWSAKLLELVVERRYGIVGPTPDTCTEPPPVCASLIIPAFNAETTIKEAIESCFAQQTRDGGVIQDVEVVVVDDGSTDRTMVVVAALQGKYGPKLILLRQNNCGVSAARNRAIRRATGPVVIYLDADDVAPADRLHKTLAEFEAMGADAIYGQEEEFDPRTAEAKRTPNIVAPSKESILQGCGFRTNACAVRRAFHVERGVWMDETMAGAEDHELLMAILTAGGRAHCSDHVMVRRRKLPGSLRHQCDWAVLKAYIRLKHRSWLEKYMGRELTFEPEMLKAVERGRAATAKTVRREMTEDLSEPAASGPPKAQAMQPTRRLHGLDCPAAARDFPEPRLARVGGWREPVKPMGAWHGHPGPAFPETGKPLRVLCYLFACRGEGIETFAANLAEACGDAVEWLFMVVGATQITGGLVRRYGEVRPHSAFDPESQYWEFLRAVLDFRPHLVHTSHHYGAWFAQHCGLPCLATIHGIIGGKHYGADWADLSVGVSPAAKKGSDLIAMSGTAPTPWPSKRDPNLVVHLGRLDEDRHPELSFEAVERIPEARLRVMGGTHNPQAAAALIEPWKRRLGDRLEYLGQLPREKARALAAEGGVIVCGVNESFGFSNAEAMTAGVFPVAIQGAGYQATMAKDWGEIVPASALGIAQGIKAVLAGGERYSEQRRHGMAEATANHYSLQKMGEDYLACYRSLAPEPVDLVVLAHNHVGVTRICVEHLMANTWWPYRLVLVDNGSDDGTHDYFRRVQELLGPERVEVVRSETNLGCSLGRNLGLRHCRSEYVYLGDNDMLVPPGWLGPAMELLRARPDVAGIALNWEGVPGPPRKGGPHEDAPTGTTIVFRRAALGEGFEEPFASLQGREDTDLNWRLIEQGWKFLRLPGVMAHHLGGLTRGPGTTRRDTAREDKLAEAQRLFDAKWAGPGVRRT